MISHDEFYKILCLKMSFLQEEFGFLPFNIDKDNFNIFVESKNDTTGIKISLEPREGGIFTYLCKLNKNKEFPKYKTEVKADSKINGFYIEDLMQVFSSSLKDELERVESYLPKEEESKKILDVHAKFLREEGSMILKGDFSVFKNAEAIVKKRADDLTK